MDNTTTLFAIFILLAFSAFFSASETAFSGLSKSRLKVMADDGNKKAALALDMSQDYDKLLSTILVGNNIVNIAMTSLATVWFTTLLASGGATVSTVVTTVMVLIFGEITPKSLANKAPETFAMGVAPMLRLCVLVLTPINWLFSLWKQVMGKIVTVEEDRVVDGEELLAIVSEAEREGGIDDVESQLIQNAIEFGDHNAMEIGTPRVDITAVSQIAVLTDLVKRGTGQGFCDKINMACCINISILQAGVLLSVDNVDKYTASKNKNLEKSAVVRQNAGQIGADCFCVQCDGFFAAGEECLNFRNFQNGFCQSQFPVRQENILVTAIGAGGVSLLYLSLYLYLFL